MRTRSIFLAMLFAAQPVSVCATTENSVEIGFVSTGGNTETQTANGKYGFKQENEKWRNTAKVEALRAEDSSTVTAEKYLVGGQTNYKFRPRAYVFANLEYEDERFSGYKYRVKGAAGLGYRVLERDSVTLDAETGPGARHSVLDNDSENNELLWHIAGNLAWTVSETTTFTEELVVDAGEDATVAKSVTALQAQINSRMAMKATFTVKNTSDVPAGVKKTDTETALTLVYKY